MKTLRQDQQYNKGTHQTLLENNMHAQTSPQALEVSMQDMLILHVKCLTAY